MGAGLASKRPPGEDWVPRSLKAIRDELLQMVGGVATSFRSTTDALEAAQAVLAAQQSQLAAQVAFLAGQITYAEHWNIPLTPGIGQVTIQPVTADTGVIWRPYDATHDTTLTVTTSSTGRLAVTISGVIEAYATDFVTAQTFFGLEILQGSTVLKSPTPDDGPTLMVYGNPAYQRMSSTAAPLLTENYVSLAPNTAYTLRTRRGYWMGAGASGTRRGEVTWSGSAISVTKLGM